MALGCLRDKGSGAGAAVQPDFFCSASHSIEIKFAADSPLEACRYYIFPQFTRANLSTLRSVVNPA
jgi:hypothetical protein